MWGRCGCCGWVFKNGGTEAGVSHASWALAEGILPAPLPRKVGDRLRDAWSWIMVAHLGDCTALLNERLHLELPGEAADKLEQRACRAYGAIISL